MKLCSYAYEWPEVEVINPCSIAHLPSQPCACAAISRLKGAMVLFDLTSISRAHLRAPNHEYEIVLKSGVYKYNEVV